MDKLIKLSAVVVACATLGACSTPRFLVAQTLIGSRSSKTILMPTAPNNQNQTLFNYVIRTCEIDAQGVESNCKDSVVLDNVVANPVN